MTGKTIRVTTTPATILRHAAKLAERRHGEDQWDTQARTLGELGYRIVGKDTQVDELKADDQRHLDAWADSHEGYTVQTRVAVVKCLWCDYIAIDATGREAVARYQREHEQPILARELAHRRAPGADLDPHGGAL